MQRKRKEEGKAMGHKNPSLVLAQASTEKRTEEMVRSLSNHHSDTADMHAESTSENSDSERVVLTIQESSHVACEGSVGDRKTRLWNCPETDRESKDRNEANKIARKRRTIKRTAEISTDGKRKMFRGDGEYEAQEIDFIQNESNRERNRDAGESNGEIAQIREEMGDLKEKMNSMMNILEKALHTGAIVQQNHSGQASTSTGTETGESV